MASERAVGAVGAQADDGILPEAARPDTLASVAYDAIREAITTRALAPGRRLTEADLANQLKVSTTPVREALVRLRQVGLIEDDDSRGGRVIRPSARRLRGAYQIREALETFTARTAAEESSEAQRRDIEAAAHESLQAAAAEDLEEFRSWDDAFHHAVAVPTANPQIRQMLDDALALIAVIVRRDIAQIETSVDAGRSHVRIFEAIVSDQPDEASREMREHLRRARDYTVKGLTDTQGITPDSD